MFSIPNLSCSAFLGLASLTTVPASCGLSNASFEVVVTVDEQDETLARKDREEYDSVVVKNPLIVVACWVVPQKLQEQ